MAKWMVAAKKADFDSIAKKFHITPILARIMRNRDLIEEEDIKQFLYGELSDLHAPLLMKDMQKAAQIILVKIKSGAAIRIIGDYDVDGICAIYILLRGLTALGGKVDTVIPHRQKDGYGLNESLITAASEENIDTIITCDNGIAAALQIDQAKHLGMTIIVTDHHEVPYEDTEAGRQFLLPNADAVVDPRRRDCEYPFKSICGAVVAYKLIQVLFQMEAQNGNRVETEQPILDELLSFAALATVCDVMELRDENRIIVKKGLALMKNTSNLGLKALLMVSGIEDKDLSPYHAGFIIGPCLNATGRLDTAKRALELFEAKDWKDAVTIATDLKSLNDSRKLMTEAGVKEAIRAVEESEAANDRVLVIYLPDCHESLAGIIAGRIKEKYGRPTFVLTKAEDGIKGSGRSIEAYSMYEEITACKSLFSKYGGHKMAAGVSLFCEEDIIEFRRLLNKNCTLTEEDFEETVHIDVPMPLDCASKAFIQELALLEPYGIGNPKPLFARKGISILSGKKLGKNGNVGKYRIADEHGATFEMIYFGDLEQLDTFMTERFGAQKVRMLYEQRLPVGDVALSMVYYPEINSFAGRESIQIVMQHYC